MRFVLTVSFILLGAQGAWSADCGSAFTNLTPASLLSAPSVSSSPSPVPAQDPDLYNIGRNYVLGVIENARLTFPKRLSPNLHRPFRTIPFYQEIPARAPEFVKNAMRRIHNLWNSPEELAKILGEIRMVLLKVEGGTVARSRALEQIRLTMEARHGFGRVLDLNDYLTTSQWNKDVLQGRRPTRDPSGRHDGTFHRQAPNSQNVHRNQWLVVMWDMERHPEKWGFPQVKASDIYAAFGDERWIKDLKYPGRTNAVTEPRQGWYDLYPFSVLFDNAIQNVDASRPHPSNPFYFQGLWEAALAVTPSD